jgi:natural product biosynthesis luciferase-like monooxygenase protein
MHNVSYRLSPIQEGMLFHHIHNPHTGIDIEQLVCSLPETVDVDALRYACQRLVDRHPVLRTSLSWEKLERPIQSVHAQVEAPFHLIDLTTLEPDGRKQRFDGFFEEDRIAGIRLDQAPLCRFTLIKLGNTDFTLIITFHHVAMDGRSFPRILNEVFNDYDARREGKSIDFPEGKAYTDYLTWLDNLDLDKAERFWRDYLRGFVLANQVPELDPSATEETGRDEEEIVLSVETTEALRALAKREQITLNTVVQGAWALMLSRYSASGDVVFGATRACRNFAPDTADMVGTFINTLPVRVHVEGNEQIAAWLKGIRNSQVEIREYEHTPLASIQSWSEIPHGAHLFESILVFDNYEISKRMQAQGGNWAKRDVRLRERTNFSLTLYGYAEKKLILRLAYDRYRYNTASVQRMMGHMRAILEAMSAGLDGTLASLPMLTDAERQQLHSWNQTKVDYPRTNTVHDLIEQQVDSSPGATALVFRNQRLSYQELDNRANQLANLLLSKGLKPGERVAVSMERSLELMVALLAVLKAGGAYVPLDPTYPPERMKYVLSDAHVFIILTQEKLRPQVQSFARVVLAIDSDAEYDALASCSQSRPRVAMSSESPAYVIYTSGSTGKPKGVVVDHRNVVNFFTGMDQKFGEKNPGVWLAVTSISFDISVLELFWTLARGYRVILQEDNQFLPANPEAFLAGAQGLEFSLFYFASDESAGADKYKLLMEGAKFADQNKFTAIWTPERHFHAFGGLFPNPAVTSAALAAITKNLKIRAGSVVLPIHDPIRVAEEWALVDNLSNGRVGISVASGWHDRDFVFKPDNYADRKNVMLRDLETIRSLWRGGSVQRVNGSGKEVSVSIFPRPIQPELPFWITSGGHPKTFQDAGETGANLLTHLLGQSFDDLASKIQLYRDAFRKSNPSGNGHVTLMLHTFVGNTDEEVQELVRTPFCNYLKSSVDLMKQVVKGLGDDLSATTLSQEDLEALIDHAFTRYFATSGLFGTVDSCMATLQKLKDLGVDEVACLVDFGIAADTVLANLNNLRDLAARANRPAVPMGYSIPEQILRHHVTHMQCTPSLARLLLGDAMGRQALASLRKFLVGGEALPPSLAAELQQAGVGEIYNMYGPTETTIWSTVEQLPPAAKEITIGRPIANTSVYVLDSTRQQVPVGVAGELYIGGEGVVPGYLDRPELTAERFVHLDFAGERAYRTGDLVKYLPDGRLYFLGRVDHQVKIRGHRIEMGEIEAALAQHPTVQEAIVATVDYADEGTALVAYVVKRGAAAPQPMELRKFLESQLPSFMVPSTFVPLDAFPRTPNGKIDRKQLPHPDMVPQQRSVIAPRNSVEEKLAAIWRECLHITDVGIRDNFFDLGGHSLLLIRLISQIQKEFGQRLPVATVLESPTIEALAIVLTGKETVTTVCRVIPLKPQGTRTPFICLGASPLFLPLARLLGPDQPFCGVDLTQLKKINLPDPCRLEDLAKYVVEAIREYQPQGPYSIGGWCLYGVLGYEAARQLIAQGQEVELLTLIDSPNVAYGRRLTGLAKAEMRAQKWLFHLLNIAKANPGEMLRYTKERLNIARLKLQRNRERVAFEMGLQDEELRLLDIDPILFYAATHYEPPPYSGRVLMVQAAETPSGQHWQMAQQWGQPLVGQSVVHSVAGGHDGMFKYPYVETLAAKIRPAFEQLGNGSQAKRNGAHSNGAPAHAARNGSAKVEEPVVQEPAAR